MANKKKLTLLCLLLLASGQALPEKRLMKPTHAHIQSALGCLSTSLVDWSDAEFKEFGIKRKELSPGNTVSIQVGFHKDYGDHPDDVYDVIFYSNDRLHGALFLMYLDESGLFMSDPSPYKLDKIGHRWEVSEGNGGGYDYLDYGRYVTKLYNATPHYRIKLRPGKCSPIKY
jgi:hypothetical protein